MYAHKVRALGRGHSAPLYNDMRPLLSIDTHVHNRDCVTMTIRTYSTDHVELIFERRVRVILLEKPMCETRARDLEYSNA